jgi:hypothetical protein
MNLLIIAGGLFIAMGLPGFYARQASKAGFWGLAGFVLMFSGLVLSHLAVHSIETVTMPEVPSRMMRFVSVAAPSIFVGILVTGIVTWKTGVYPPSVGIVIILAANVGLLTVIPGVPLIVSRNLASTVFPVSMLWAGIQLMIG